MGFLRTWEVSWWHRGIRIIGASVNGGLCMSRPGSAGAFAGQILQRPRSETWNVRALAERADRCKNGQDACRAYGFGAQASPHQEGREADHRPLQPGSTGVLGDACGSLELERNERQGICNSASNIAVQPAQMARSDCRRGAHDRLACAASCQRAVANKHLMLAAPLTAILAGYGLKEALRDARRGAKH